MPKSSGQGNWVTINGVHVLIDGNKKIIKGPKNLIGMTPRQAIGLDSTDSKSSAPKAESTAKKSPTKETKTSSKTTTSKRTTAKSLGYGKADLAAKSTSQLIKEQKALSDPDEWNKDPKASQIKRDAISNELYKRTGSVTGESKRTPKHTTSDGKEVKPFTKNEGMQDRLKESAKKRNVEATTNKKSGTAKTEKSTSGKSSEGTFTVDGVKYTLKQTPDGGQITYQDEGFTVLHGWNKDYKDIDTAIKTVKETNQRIAQSKKADQIAKKTGGIALYTGKVIMPGSVKREGNKYTAVDAQTKKTITLDERDVGGLFVAAYDSAVSRALKSSTSNKAVAPTPSKKNVSSTTPKTGNALFDNATKSNKATSGKPSSGLDVVHYDGFGRRGSWNEYKINGKKVSAKEARQQFPDMFDSKGRYSGGKK